MHSFRRYMDVAMLVLGVVLLPALVGCNGLGSGLGLAVHSPPETTSPPKTDKAAAGKMSADDRAVFATVQEKDAQGREHCVWTRNVDPKAPFRWQYPKLDAVFAQPAEQWPDLIRLFEDSDPKVAFNAAIALGRSRDYRTVFLLSRAVQTPTMPVPLRCAAAETLGFLNDPRSTSSEGNKIGNELQKLIDQYGHYVPKSPSYIPELHEELLRGLARREDAAVDERFLAALKSPRAEVRFVALKAWSESISRKLLPAEVVDLRTDVDPHVRAAALRAIVAQKHPQSLDYLQRALTDLHFTVRKEAINSLGVLGGNEAAAILKELYKDRADGIRAEVVTAWAAMKDEPSLISAVGDKSWRVRLKAASSLAAYPDDAAAAAIEKLLVDASGEVQMAAIRALETWPLERSGPILLAAMDKPAYMVRKAAAAQLAQRWPEAAKFSVDAPADRRTQMLNDLCEQFRRQYGIAHTKGRDSVASQERRRQAVLPESIAEAETMIRAGDVEALSALGPRLIDVLEAMRFERKQTLPEEIYREVLPKIRPEFIALDRMTSKEAAERRGGAQELQSIAAKQTCGRLAFDRLSQLMAAENDDLVWLNVLQTLADENGPEAPAICYDGLGHSSSEVRRRACVYLADHPDRRHVPMLLPALNDQQPLVVCAAVEALAASGMDDASPLKRLMNSTNEEIQLVVATALVKLDDPAGKPALERMAYSNDPQIRARVARVMGDYPDPAFLPILIHFLNDKASVTHAALKSLPQVAGEDQAKPTTQAPLSTAEQISRWKRWYERQADRAGSNQKM